MDIAKNEADRGLAQLSKFLGECSNTNVLVVGTPKRHDLRESSCVNKEVDKFNRQLHKRLKICEHVKVIDSIIRKEYYTKHGLHFNNRGKELMAQLIIDQIYEKTNTNPPIQLP
jgi:RNase H-fold protein (predicted Holliday junction resolvase)